MFLVVLIMSVFQENAKSRRRLRILAYGLVLVLIIALSTITAFLYSANQSLQRDLMNDQIEELNRHQDDIFGKLVGFMGRFYSDLETLNYSLSINATSSDSIRNFETTMADWAESVWNDFKIDMNVIRGLSWSLNEPNDTVYDNITEVVRLALGQVMVLFIDRSVETMPQLYLQFSNVTGISHIVTAEGEATTYANGLPAIAWSFLQLSHAWESHTEFASIHNVPVSIQIPLNFILGNATELYASLTAWSNFKPDVLIR